MEYWINFDKDILEQVKTYLFDWFGINSDYELLKVNYFTIDKKKVKNWFLIEYLNSKTLKEKRYYIDFDYINNENSVVPYASSSDIIEIHTVRPFFNDYFYTQKKICELISSKYNDPS